MKKDIDALMEQRGLDAIMVSGSVHNNPPLYYLLDGAGLTRAVLIKRLGETPVLVANPMERDEAAAAGYPIILSTRYKYSELLAQCEGDRLAAAVVYHCRILEDLGVTGRLGCYGLADQGEAYVFLDALNAATPDIDIGGEFGTNLLEKARETKEPFEVSRIREVARRTAEVVQQTVHFLQSHTVDQDEVLRKKRGEPLTVGDVRAHIQYLLAVQGLEDPEGVIFSTGRDAGVPHTKGTRSAPIKLGAPIVFDIFPREVGGGYFFDMTRTFCLGYAAPRMQQLHQEVLACLNRLKSAIQVDTETRIYQRMACEFFEARHHPTLAQDASTLKGYVHGLGHGIGLDLHEAPIFFDNPANTTRLAPGHIFTLEPGLYYPDEGCGCRLEDVLWIDETGRVHNLTDYPYDLVIPMRA